MYNRLSTVFFVLLNFVCYSQTIIQTSIFKVNYSESLEQPLWLEYDIICNNGDVERQGMKFKRFSGVHTSDELDYKNNVWDKGHLAPAATFDCTKDMLDETFSFLNCALQHSNLNRGVWAQLEKFERELALSYDVSVRVDLIFDEFSLKLTTGATVASFFVKTISYDDKNLIIRFPNKDVSGMKWRDFIQ